MDKQKLDIFVKSFRSNEGYNEFVCQCGTIFMNTDINDWDCKNGNDDDKYLSSRYDDIRNSERVVKLNGPVDTVYLIDGTEFAAKCDCWYKEAMAFMRVLDNNRTEIIKYFKLEKERRLNEVSRLEDIDN